MFDSAEELFRQARRLKIERDLNRLGIAAMVEPIFVEDEKLLMRNWYHLIGFYTQEDMNLYKLTGQFPEAPFDVKYTICKKA